MPDKLDVRWPLGSHAINAGHLRESPCEPGQQADGTFFFPVLGMLLAARVSSTVTMQAASLDDFIRLFTKLNKPEWKIASEEIKARHCLPQHGGRVRL